MVLSMEDLVCSWVELGVLVRGVIDIGIGRLVEFRIHVSAHAWLENTLRRGILNGKEIWHRVEVMFWGKLNAGKGISLSFRIYR